MIEVGHMEFIEATKLESRITKRDKEGRCQIVCDNCPLAACNNGFNIDCVTLKYLHPEKYEQILINYAKEHPIKTNKDVLFETFPKTHVDGNGLPHYDPCHFGLCKSGDYCDEHSCEDCRKEYWNKEYKGRCENE